MFHISIIAIVCENGDMSERCSRSVLLLISLTLKTMEGKRTRDFLIYSHNEEGPCILIATCLRTPVFFNGVTGPTILD